MSAAGAAALGAKLKQGGLGNTQVRERLVTLGQSPAHADQAAAALPADTPAPVDPPAAGGPSTSGGGSQGHPLAGGLKPAMQMPKMSAPQLPSMSLTPPRRLDSGDLGGFLFGLFTYAMVLTYLRYGPEGLTGWYRAKFLNQPFEAVTEPTPRDNPAAGLTNTRPGKPTEV